MKPTVLSTLTAVMLSSVFAVAQAQTSSSTSAATDATTPAATSTTQGSATVTSNKDAAHALEEAKKACKAETSAQAQQDCMKKAQDDYKASLKLRSETKSEPAKK